MNKEIPEEKPADADLIESIVERYGYRFIVVHNPVTNISYMKSGSKVKIETEKEISNDQA